MRSSTETWREAFTDAGHLMAFRWRTVRRRGAVLVGLLVVLALTWVFATAPAGFRNLRNADFADLFDQLTQALSGNLGIGLAAFVVLGIASSMGGGGGRELLSRSEGAIHPIGPVTEHIAALVLSPLNLAWMVQAWGLLAASALLAPTGRLGGGVAVVLAWVVAASAVAQAIGWAVEGVRRTPHGVVLVRVGTGAFALVVLVLHLTGTLLPLVGALPTTAVAEAMYTDAWPLVVLLLLVLAVVAGWAGAWPARWALGMPPREELKVESGVHEARHLPTPRWLSPDLALLVRLDRGSVWRSVGMRRGLLVLGIGPGLIALLSAMSWNSIILLPGLAASGATLLFGVNAWCLDGKGMVWRSTLPIAPGTVFTARTLIVLECILATSTVTLVLATVRAGLPGLVMGLAVVACWLVVSLQVLATSMWWSVRSPYGVDLTSPRATPAPHAVMAGYSGRLALSTTLTGLWFSAVGALFWWWLPIVSVVPFLLWSGLRLRRARRTWLDAPERARIALTVAAV